MAEVKQTMEQRLATATRSLTNPEDYLVLANEYNRSYVEANNSTDVAIKGAGYFVLRDPVIDDIVITRKGNFNIDQCGYITNALGYRVQGYNVDADGVMSTTLEDMRVTQANLAPKATTNININVNLDAAAVPPTVIFQTQFTPYNPPSATTFNNSTSRTIYDALGNEHLFSLYFVKASALNQWRMHIGIDGRDVTPKGSPTPTGILPQNYSGSELAAPFTLQFTHSGIHIPHSLSKPSIFYGDAPISSTNLGFHDTGTHPGLNLQDLTINGVPISPALADDQVSTAEQANSAVSIAAAINRSISRHGVTAVANANQFNLGIVTAGILTPGDFILNGVQIVDATGTEASILSKLQTATMVTGITVSQPEGPGTSILLTGDDGRNIQLVTNGTTAGADFSNFRLNVAKDKTLCATYRLYNEEHHPIVIGGIAPGNVGLTAGPLAGIIYQSSDCIQLPDWDPGTGASSPNPLTVNFSGSQFASPFSIIKFDHDGYAPAALNRVAFNEIGVLEGYYTNGETINLGCIALAGGIDDRYLIERVPGSNIYQSNPSTGDLKIAKPKTGSFGFILCGYLEDFSKSPSKPSVDYLMLNQLTLLRQQAVGEQFQTAPRSGRDLSADHMSSDAVDSDTPSLNNRP